MNRLKYLREENGKTQNEVAKYLGIKGPAYNLIENGQRRLSAKMLEKLAEYFDVSTGYILGCQKVVKKKPTHIGRLP